VLVGGTGTGKTHLAIAIARSCIRAGKRGRFFNTVELVTRLETEARAGRQGRFAEYLTRMDFVVFDELGYLPSLNRAGSCSFTSSAGYMNEPRSSSRPISPLANGRVFFAMRK